jgi:Cu/Ag efflux pump CusA
MNISGDMVKNFKAQSAIQEAIATIGTLIILGIIIYAFYTIPTPIQAVFQNTINDLIIGVIVVAVVAIIFYFLFRS